MTMILLLTTLLALAGCSQAPTEKPPVLAGYEIVTTGSGCRDLASGEFVTPDHCGAGREQPH